MTNLIGDIVLLILSVVVIIADVITGLTVAVLCCAGVMAVCAAYLIYDYFKNKTEVKVEKKGSKK